MANEEDTKPETQIPVEEPQEAEPTPEEERAKLQQAHDELKDRLLRTAADFENFKKRTKREMDEAQTRGREGVLKEILPVLDNLERALQHAAEKDPLAVGVRMVEKQLLGALEKFGISRFSAVGQPFDPTMHDAIQQVETAEMPPGTVAMEFAKGYKAGDRLVRPAMVAVAKAPAASAQPDGAGES